MYFDCVKNYDLIEECLLNQCNVNWEVLAFATDYYGVTSWIEAIIDYYDLEEDVEKYMEENRKDED